MQARDVMTTNVITVGPETDVAETAKRLLEHRISALPVVEPDGRIVGIVSEGDLMRRTESETERQPSGQSSKFATKKGSSHFRKRRMNPGQSIIIVYLCADLLSTKAALCLLCTRQSNAERLLPPYDQLFCTFLLVL